MNGDLLSSIMGRHGDESGGGGAFLGIPDINIKIGSFAENNMSTVMDSFLQCMAPHMTVQHSCFPFGGILAGLFSQLLANGNEFLDSFSAGSLGEHAGADMGGGGPSFEAASLGENHAPSPGPAGTVYDSHAERVMSAASYGDGNHL